TWVDIDDIFNYDITSGDWTVEGKLAIKNDDMNYMSDNIILPICMRYEESVYIFGQWMSLFGTGTRHVYSYNVVSKNSSAISEYSFSDLSVRGVAFGTTWRSFAILALPGNSPGEYYFILFNYLTRSWIREEIAATKFMLQLYCICVYDEKLF